MLGSEMIDFQFSDYHQMHDFYRLTAVIFFAIYNVCVLTTTPEIFSESNLFCWSSNRLVIFLIGQAFLVVFLTVIDGRCFLREVDIKSEKLQTRLNLVRYISHEMRSPLNSIFMGLQLLHNDASKLLNTIQNMPKKSTPMNLAESFSTQASQLSCVTCTNLQDILAIQISAVESILETNDLIQESSSVALETLNDMLTFDKMDEKKLVIEVGEVDVWSFVTENVRPFSLNATKNNVALSVACMDQESNWMDQYRIKADKFKLNQVLRNFMSNALKFANNVHGEVKVVVERKAMSDKMTKALEVIGESTRDCVRVSVVDNGCGISAENQKQLFGQYVQFNASALQKGGGSGLGLWISKSKPIRL